MQGRVLKMDWGTFWTAVAQVSIVVVLIFIVAGVIAGVVDAQRKDERDERDGDITIYKKDDNNG